jgi:hypothetical protein
LGTKGKFFRLKSRYYVEAVSSFSSVTFPDLVSFENRINSLNRCINKGEIVTPRQCIVKENITKFIDCSKKYHTAVKIKEIMTLVLHPEEIKEETKNLISDILLNSDPKIKLTFLSYNNLTATEISNPTQGFGSVLFIAPFNQSNKTQNINFSRAFLGISINQDVQDPTYNQFVKLIGINEVTKNLLDTLNLLTTYMRSPHDVQVDLPKLGELFEKGLDFIDQIPLPTKIKGVLESLFIQLNNFNDKITFIGCSNTQISKEILNFVSELENLDYFPSSPNPFLNDRYENYFVGGKVSSKVSYDLPHNYFSEIQKRFLSERFNLPSNFFNHDIKTFQITSFGSASESEASLNVQAVFCFFKTLINKLRTPNSATDFVLSFKELNELEKLLTFSLSEIEGCEFKSILREDSTSSILGITYTREELVAEKIYSPDDEDKYIRKLLKNRFNKRESYSLNEPAVTLTAYSHRAIISLIDGGGTNPTPDFSHLDESIEKYNMMGAFGVRAYFTCLSSNEGEQKNVLTLIRPTGVTTKVLKEIESPITSPHAATLFTQEIMSRTDLVTSPEIHLAAIHEGGRGTLYEALSFPNSKIIFGSEDSFITPHFAKFLELNGINVPLISYNSENLAEQIELIVDQEILEKLEFKSNAINLLNAVNKYNFLFIKSC